MGQAEPYVVLSFSEDTLETLRSQLNTLQRLVDRTADNADASSTDLSNRLSAISGVLDTASGHAEDLTDQLSDYGDGVISEINRGSDILADALDQLSAISEQVTDLSGPITKSINKLETAARKLVQAGDASSGAMDTLQWATADLTTASSLLKAACPIYPMVQSSCETLWKPGTRLPPDRRWPKSKRALNNCPRRWT